MTAQLLRPEIDPSKHARNAVQSKVSPGFTAMHGASGDCACHASFIAKPDKSVDAHAFQSTGVEDGRLLPNDRPQRQAAKPAAAAAGAIPATFAVHTWTAV